MAKFLTSAPALGTLVVVLGPAKLWAQATAPYEVANCDVITDSCVDTEGNPVALPIDQKTNIWKGRDGLGLDAIQPGDHIDAQIEITPTGERRVKNLWVNIANVTGVVSKLNSHGFELLITQGNGVGTPGWKPGQLLPVLVGDNAVVNSGLVTKSAIGPGLGAQVIGLGLPGGKAGVRQVLATTILLHNKNGVMVGGEHLPIQKGSAQ